MATGDIRHHSMTSIAVVGTGVLGEALMYGLVLDELRYVEIDPAYYSTTISDVEDFTDIFFVCVPTNASLYGHYDMTHVHSVMAELSKNNYDGLVVLKSTVTPEDIDGLADYNLNLVYEPEFLTEANAREDFIMAPLNVIGGPKSLCHQLSKFNATYRIKNPPEFIVDFHSASMLKLVINSWLATKVSFFNEIETLHSQSDTETTWSEFVNILTKDPRMGNTHMQVPGPDGLRGYGGKCFPKDVNAFLDYAESREVELGVLLAAKLVNDIERET